MKKKSETPWMDPTIKNLLIPAGIALVFGIVACFMSGQQKYLQAFGIAIAICGLVISIYINIKVRRMRKQRQK